MWTDVIDLRDFYNSNCGRVARRMIRRGVREFWPNVIDMRLLGLGFATPYLRPFMQEANRTIAAMPARQGVLHWPRDGTGLTVLIDEVELPFEDLSIDRVLLVHALENAESVRPLLREVWRVLAGSGKLLIVTPNRSGIWARIERTPLGHGRPYSSGQLSTLLRDNMFTPLSHKSALFVPPIESRMLLSSSSAWEKMGTTMLSHFGGVIIMEATKQLYAGQSNTQTSERQYVITVERASGNSPRNVSYHIA